MTLDETLAAIEAVESKATKGKWTAYTLDTCVAAYSGRTKVASRQCHSTSDATYNQTEIDIAFICLMREIFPSLLRLVRRQAEELKQHRTTYFNTVGINKSIAATDHATADLVKAWEGCK